MLALVKSPLNSCRQRERRQTFIRANQGIWHQLGSWRIINVLTCLRRKPARPLFQSLASRLHLLYVNCGCSNTVYVCPHIAASSTGFANEQRTNNGIPLLALTVGGNSPPALYRVFGIEEYHRWQYFRPVSKISPLIVPSDREMLKQVGFIVTVPSDHDD